MAADVYLLKVALYKTVARIEDVQLNGEFDYIRVVTIRVKLTIFKKQLY